MLRRTPLFQALQRERISSGLQPDLHPALRLLWEAAENVTFFSGKVVRRLAPALAFDAGADQIRGLSQMQDSNGVRWVWAASGGDVVRWYGPAPEAIVTMAWQENDTSALRATFFDFTHFGDWTIINSSNGPAKLHKPGIGLTDYADAPQNVIAFQKKFNFMLAFGYGPRGTRVGWSDADNIEEWTAAADNAAGALSLEELNTPIRAAYRLGSASSVYAEDQMALVTYISAPFYFGGKVVLDGIGAVGKMAVTGDGAVNYGVGRRGIWWTDGNTYRYIDEGFLRDYLQDNVNWTQASKIVAVRNDYNGCFEFSFPMGAELENSEGWSYDPRTGGWSPVPPFSSKDERKLFQRVLVGDVNGNVSYDEFDEDAPAPLVLTTKPLLMQVQSEQGLTDIHTTSRIDELVVLMKECVGIEFRIGTAHNLGLPFEWTEWKTMGGADTTYLLDFVPDGVYVKLDFRSTMDNWKFNLQGFMIFGEVEGTKRETQ